MIITGNETQDGGDEFGIDREERQQVRRPPPFCFSLFIKGERKRGLEAGNLLKRGAGHGAGEAGGGSIRVSSAGRFGRSIIQQPSRRSSKAA